MSSIDSRERTADTNLAAFFDGEDCAIEIVLAMNISARGTVGCCYYDARNETLYVLDDMKYGGLSALESLKTTLEPTSILFPARTQSTISSIIDPLGSQIEDKASSGQFSLPYATEMRADKEFNYEEGKRNLLELQLLSQQGRRLEMWVPGNESHETPSFQVETGFTKENARSLRLACLIDMSNHVSIGCISAVLQYLERRRGQVFLPQDPNTEFVFRIQKLEMFSLDKMMYLPAETMAALQIMEFETHPHSQNQGPNSYGSKESLSVYGLFHRLATSPQGKQKLRQVFLRPTTDLRNISERHAAVSVFLQSSNDQITESITKSLKSIRNMRGVLQHLRKGMTSGLNGKNSIRNGVWMTLRSFAFHTLEILSKMRQLRHSDPLDIKSRVLETVDPRCIALLGQDITKTVDFRSSTEESRTIINPAVDEELDAMKRTYTGIDDFLNELSREVITDIPLEQDLSINVVTYPHIGFLIAIQKNQQPDQLPSLPKDNDGRSWEPIFSSEGAAYYKDSRMRALDVRFGDIAGHIYDREIEIAFELGQRTLKHEDFLCKVSDTLGDLDVILALTRGAQMYSLVRPAMTYGNEIEIIGGRHILQEQITRNFIPNNTFLARHQVEANESSVYTQRDTNEEANVLIVTGPNFSGKSVYLRQVALIVYLAQIGSFVPAQQATIGLTDKIITRITTRETVSKQHSAFVIDVHQVASAIRMMTDRSLLVIDEFGKGTDANEGAGLMYAVLKYLLSDNTPKSKALVATHFHEIFERNLLGSCRALAFAHMAVLMKPEDEGEDVTYLYELRAGRSVASYGTVCAAMCGIPSSVIERATQIIRRRAHGAQKTGQALVEARSGRLEDEARQFLACDLRCQPNGHDGQFFRRFLNNLLKSTIADPANSDTGQCESIPERQRH